MRRSETRERRRTLQAERAAQPRRCGGAALQRSSTQQRQQYARCEASARR